MSQRLAEIADLIRYGSPETSARTILDRDKNLALDSASDEAAAELNRRYEFPLTSWGEDLKRVVSVIAAYELFSGIRGFDSAGQGSSLKIRADAARAWLKRVGDGELAPPDLVDATPDVADGGASVVTSPRRGW